MDYPIIYLTETEQLALNILADTSGYGYVEVKRKCKVTSALLCPLLASIRRKTGIADTKDPQQIQRYLLKYEQASGQPDEKQLEMLRRITGVGFRATGPQTLEGASYHMHLSTTAGQQLFTDALHSIGIFTPEPREQRVQTLLFLASHYVEPKGEHLTENHLAAMRAYAEHVNAQPEELARLLGPDFSEGYVKLLLKQGMERLGICARGRGVQRRLVKLALQRMEKEQPASPVPSSLPAVTMDDPAF